MEKGAWATRVHMQEEAVLEREEGEQEGVRRGVDLNRVVLLQLPVGDISRMTGNLQLTLSVVF
jgi:hypothetical protein